MKVVWSPLAVERTAEIARYIAEDNLIIYKLEPPQISILTIRHGKQILPAEELK